MPSPREKHAKNAHKKKKNPPTPASLLYVGIIFVSFTMLRYMNVKTTRRRRISAVKRRIVRFLFNGVPLSYFFASFQARRRYLSRSNFVGVLDFGVQLRVIKVVVGVEFTERMLREKYVGCWSI